MAIRMVALGDSTTCGIGDPLPDGRWRGFVPLLAGSLGAGAGCTNLAVSGARVADVRNRQLPRAVRRRPHLATLIVGVNDTMRSDFDAAGIRADLLFTAGSLVARGATLLTVRLHDPAQVFGLPGVLARPLARRVEAVNVVFDEVHETYGGVRIDLAAHPWTYRRESWSVDRMHPSEIGHRHLARAFAEALDAAGWPVDHLPPVSCAGGASPTRTADVAWMVTKGVPWVVRRARDLVPWAAGMVIRETATAVTRRVRRRRQIAFPA